MEADLLPARTEGGTGAIVSWGGKLWVVTYVSSKKPSGAGTGLYEIGPDFVLKRRPESLVGTYANRMIHLPSQQLFIGPHAIDAEGKVRTMPVFEEYRLGGTMEHLSDPENKIYMLGMEGHFFEVNVHSLEVKLLADLKQELKLPTKTAVHFKAGWTGHGRVVVANNSYDEPDYLGECATGRLAEWDGKEWTIISDQPFNEVHGRKSFGHVIYATGWDRASALFYVFAKGKWSKYRLPKASHTFDQYWQTEWPRIREVEHERFLMDCHGLFYELSPVAYEGKVWGVRPICSHLRVIPDFCTYRGLLVLGGDQATPGGSANLLTGNSQSNFWLGDIDQLWNFGKPKGWGGPWWESKVTAREPSDPYLMTGFDQKCLHLSHDSKSAVVFSVEIDFLGNGTWKSYDEIRVGPKGYVHHEFPAGFSAHWVRVTPSKSCVASGYFTYT
jgi:hypothetical protein